MIRFSFLPVIGFVFLAFLGSSGKTFADDAKQKMSFEGEVRTYLIHLSGPSSASKPIPLLMVLHGAGRNGESMVKLTNGEFDKLSDSDDFLVVYPEAVDKHWNDGRTAKEIGYGNKETGKLPNDVGFLSALIDRLIATRNVDPRRVYVTGMSNGALMAYRLGCEIPERLAAIAPVDGSLVKEMAQTIPSRPLSVLVINNTKDPLIHWDGGNITSPFGKRTFGKTLAVRESVDFWVRRDHGPAAAVTVNLPAVASGDDTRVRREEFHPGDEGTEVVLYSVEGGGHTWPGGLQYAPVFVVGKTSHQIDACQIIWDFFKAHSRA